MFKPSRLNSYEIGFTAHANHFADHSNVHSLSQLTVIQGVPAVSFILTVILYTLSSTSLKPIIWTYCII